MGRGGLLLLFASFAAWLSANSAEAAVRPLAGQMTLSLNSAVLSLEDTRRSASACRKWRALAARLGETYAGHQLRQTVSTRFCAMTPPSADDDVWGWPWRNHDVRADLPPIRHGRYGAWEIRCGEVGRRQRCALAQETVMTAGLDPEAHPLRVVTHVVIDTVAGRESVLWRVHVAGERPAEPAAGIVISVAGRVAHEPFDACGRRGCMSEADPRLSAEVTSWLWSGKPLPITLDTRANGSDQVSPVDGVLSPDGFNRGFSELIRLRRHEVKALAGR